MSGFSCESSARMDGTAFKRQNSGYNSGYPARVPIRLISSSRSTSESTNLSGSFACLRRAVWFAAYRRSNARTMRRSPFSSSVAFCSASRSSPPKASCSARARSSSGFMGLAALGLGGGMSAAADGPPPSDAAAAAFDVFPALALLSR